MPADATVAALFVAAGGVYFGLDGVEPWDESRDAMKYAGPWPVVAHPPCARWCGLARLVEARYGYKVGDDGGAFDLALGAVRGWGGVLEHPAKSLAWGAYELPRPPSRGWVLDPFHGSAWVCEVSQRAYGHQATKLTWLYYVGDTPPPPMDWSRPKPVAGISFLSRRGDGSHWRDFRDLPRLRGKAASATPPAFRDALLELARISRSTDLEAASNG